MRRLIWSLLAIAVLWSGWWAIAAFGMRQGLESWLAERRAAGWQAEAGASALFGYPSEIRLRLQDLLLADTARGVALAVPGLDISAPAIWPGRATLAFGDAPMILAAPTGRAALTARDAAARLHLHPGPALELAEMGLASGPWDLASEAGALLSAPDLDLRMLQQPEAETSYAISAQVTDLTPGALLRQSWRVPETLPKVFDRFSLRMTARFDRPWDLAAIEGARPQPTNLELDLAEATWGALALRASGAVEVDAEGRATGTVAVQARNWRDMLALAETSGALPKALRPQAERLLDALAGASGNPEALDLTLSLSGGRISLGFLPLGEAPRFLLR